LVYFDLLMLLSNKNQGISDMKEFSFSSLFSFIIIPVSLLFTACYQKCNCSDPVPITATKKTTLTFHSDTITYTSASRYARVNSFYPTSNWVSQMNCLQANVGTVGGNFLITRGYFTMDLSSLPADTSQIKSTVLVLHSNFDAADPYYGGNQGTGAVTNNSFYLSRIISAWNDTTITWYNQPTVSSTDSITVAANGSINQVFTIDITSLVKKAFALGQANYGFRIRMIDETTEYNSINIITGVSKPSDRIYAEKLGVQYYK